MQTSTTAILLIVLFAAVALAAIPPLSKERLVEMSSVIVTGRIVTVTTQPEVPREGYEDTLFQVQVEVTKVEKGNAKVGQVITCTASKPSKRPDGWVGPQGQNVCPAEGAQVRCHLQGDASTGYSLLEPNGLELLKEPTTKP